MNMALFRLINGLANKNIFFDKLMIFSSTYMEYIYILILAAVFVLGVYKKNGDCRKAAFNTFIVAAISLILNFVIGSFYYMDRPFVHNKVNLLVQHSKDASFPSDHATGTMSIAVGMGKYNKSLSILLTVLSIMVGFSRVYVGNHYPMDVIGGYIVALIVNYFYNTFVRNKVNSIYDTIEKKLLLRLGLIKFLEHI